MRLHQKEERLNLHKKILGHMVIGLKQVRVPIGNLVPSPNMKNHLLSLSELADRK